MNSDLRLYPCPRCNGNRPELEAACLHCFWKPAPASSRVNRWNRLPLQNPAALDELLSIFQQLKATAIGVAVYLALFGLHFMLRNAVADWMMGLAFAGVIILGGWVSWHELPNRLWFSRNCTTNTRS